MILKNNEFKPLHSNEVNLYSCGLTVYDHAHLGHAKSLYFVDTLVRVLQHNGYNVKFARNITDIDDKIIARSVLQNIDYTVFVESQIQAFKNVTNLLGLISPTYEPRVTNYIPQIITFIQRLIDNGFAYHSHDDVFFDITKFVQYGKLSGKNIAELQTVGRAKIQDDKRHPLDFVLWKLAKPNEPSWDSPWGKGRPGWHIECSTMINSLFGEQIDIHCGGKDLIFPHHENEIAQSESLTSKPLAQHWLHNGFALLNGLKVSKSNSKTLVYIKDVLNTHSPNVLRFAFMQSHYTSDINITDNFLDVAKQGLNRIMRYINTHDADKSFTPSQYSIEFFDALNLNLNTPKAISIIFKMVAEKAASAEIKSLMQFLGFKFNLTLNGDDIKIQHLIEQRLLARRSGDYATSDRLRAELLSYGVEVHDPKV